MKIFNTIQTIFTVLLTSVNLVELLVASGNKLSSEEKQAQALEGAKTLYKQISGSDLPAWIPSGLLKFIIDQVVVAFNRTGWFNKATVDDKTVKPGGLENALSSAAVQ
jgi:hypothetical protein